VPWIDSSALLKLLWQEPERDAVRDQRALGGAPGPRGERTPRHRFLAGRHGKARRDCFRTKLAEFRGTDPFRFRPLPGTVFEIALRQHVGAGRTHRCKLDRLHQAAHVAEVDLAVDALPEQVAPGAGLADNSRVIVPSARRFLSCAYLGA